LRTFGGKDAIGVPESQLIGLTADPLLISGGLHLFVKYADRQSSLLRPEAPRSRLQAQLGLNGQMSQSELSLADAMHQLDAGDCDRRIPEPLEA
jgi:hypothetical protein